jgi:hypothetical protein
VLREGRWRARERAGAATPRPFVSIYYSSRLPLAAPGPEFPGIVFGQRVVRLVLGPGGEDGLVLLVDRKELGGVGGLYAPYYYDNDDDFYFDNDYYDRYFDDDFYFFNHYSYDYGCEGPVCLID